MILNLAHTNLHIFSATRKFVIECYNVTNKFPKEEKFGIVSQIRRAAVSVHLNISEGCSRKSENERKRFFEISRGSLIEVDTAFDISLHLCFINDADLQDLFDQIISIFKMLSALISSNVNDMYLRDVH